LEQFENFEGLFDIHVLRIGDLLKFSSHLWLKVYVVTAEITNAITADQVKASRCSILFFSR